MRRILTPLVTSALVLFLALPALALPKDKYDPKGPEVSPARFKATLAQEEYAWVMFTDSNPDVPKTIRDQGEKFWKVLKAKYENQVQTYIKIDTNGWPDKARAAKKEILDNTYPAYALYEKGEVMNVGTMYAVIINGAPMEVQYEAVFEFINEISHLK